MQTELCGTRPHRRSVQSGAHGSQLAVRRTHAQRLERIRIRRKRAWPVILAMAGCTALQDPQRPRAWRKTAAADGLGKPRLGHNRGQHSPTRTQAADRCVGIMSSSRSSLYCKKHWAGLEEWQWQPPDSSSLTSRRVVCDTGYGPPRGGLQWFDEFVLDVLAVALVTIMIDKDREAIHSSDVCFAARRAT